MGVDERGPRTPEVFEAKTSWALNESSELSVHQRGNYRSVQGYEGQVEGLFEHERELGWMECISNDEARAQQPHPGVGSSQVSGRG